MRSARPHLYALADVGAVYIRTVPFLDNHGVLLRLLVILVVLSIIMMPSIINLFWILLHLPSMENVRTRCVFPSLIRVLPNLLVFKRDCLIVVCGSLLNAALLLHLAAHMMHSKLFTLIVRIVCDVALTDFIDAVTCWNHLQVRLLGLLELILIFERANEVTSVLKAWKSARMASPDLTGGYLALDR